MYNILRKALALRNTVSDILDNDFHNGTRVPSLTISKPEDAGEEDGKAVQQTRPVHRLRRNRDSDWPEREEHGNDGPNESKDVHDDAEFAQMPGAVVHQLRVLEALVEEETEGKEVRTEKASNDEGNDGIEGDGGTDIDEREETSDEGRETDRVERELSSRLHLLGTKHS